MNSDFQTLMSEATRLTQSGDLANATALIQRALNGGGASVNGSNGAAVSDVIDVHARRIDDDSASSSTTTPGGATATAADRFGDTMREPVTPPTSDRAPMHAFSGGANPLAGFMPAFDPQALAALNGNGGGNSDLLAQLMATLGNGLAGASDDESGDGDGDETAVLDAEEAAAPAKADATAQRDQFIAGRFGNRRSGRRAWKLYVPPQAATGQRLPLVVMLHGCTQNPDDFARGTAMNEAARARGFYVLYPAQSHKMNPQRCWNWFKHTHQQRGRGEPALIAAMVRDISARYEDIDPSRVYVAGLSAGGAMAAILGQTYPDLFAAVGVHSGLAAGAANDLPSALAAMQAGAAGGGARGASSMPTIVFHGDTDHTVNVKNAEQLLAASVGSVAAAALVPETVAAAGGHARGATRRVHRDARGVADAELWIVHGAPHAWSGGNSGGSFTDPAGPNASAEMLRFFGQHQLHTVN